MRLTRCRIVRQVGQCFHEIDVPDASYGPVFLGPGPLGIRKRETDSREGANRQLSDGRFHGEARTLSHPFRASDETPVLRKALLPSDQSEREPARSTAPEKVLNSYEMVGNCRLNDFSSLRI